MGEGESAGPVGVGVEDGPGRKCGGWGLGSAVESRGALQSKLACSMANGYDGAALLAACSTEKLAVRSMRHAVGTCRNAHLHEPSGWLQMPARLHVALATRQIWVPGKLVLLKLRP